MMASSLKQQFICRYLYTLFWLWAGCEIESHWWRGLLNATLVCLWFVADWLFSTGTPVSSTNKTDHHYLAEILLKVALNTITPSLWNNQSLLYLHNAACFAEKQQISIHSLSFDQTLDWNHYNLFSRQAFYLLYHQCGCKNYLQIYSLIKLIENSLISPPFH